MLHCSLTTITTIVYFDMCNRINSCSLFLSLNYHASLRTDDFWTKSAFCPLALAPRRLSISQIAGPMCPVLDPAMVTTVNFFHGNEFYMARRAKSAWLLLARR